MKALLVSALGLIAASALATGIPGQGTWESTLHGRDLDADGVYDAFFDSSQNLTWLDPRLTSSGATPFWGQDAFAASQAWLSHLSIGGVTGWRLPVVLDPEAIPCDDPARCGNNVWPSTSEITHLFYETLGNKAKVLIGPDDYGWVNRGLFSHFPSHIFLSGPSKDSADPRIPWVFTYLGAQIPYDPLYGLPYAFLAVRDGDVAVVPEPTTESPRVSRRLQLWRMEP